MKDHIYRITAKTTQLPNWEFNFVDPGDEFFTADIWQETDTRWVVIAYWDFWDYNSLATTDHPERIAERLNQFYKSLDEALDALNLFMRRWGRFTRPLLTKEVLAWAQLQPDIRLDDFRLENQPELTGDELDDLLEAELDI